MKAKRIIIASAGIAAIVLAILLYRFLPGILREKTPYGGDLLTVTFLDVGQAESILIGTPGGEFIMVDAGNQDDIGLVNDELWLAGAKHLALCAATHPHEDHIGAMTELLYSPGADNLVLPDYDCDTYFVEKMLEAAEQEHIPVVFPETGEVIYDKDDVVITVVYNGAGAEDANNASLMLRLTYDEVSLLLTGDAEQAEEMRAIQAGAELRADILDLGHHGASDAAYEPFLDRVKMKYGVISCGRNNEYGHPHDRTLFTMARYGVKLYRTDEMGTLRFASDGKTWKLP